MNPAIARWNEADREFAQDAMLACCGAQRWAAAMTAQRPVANETELHNAADRTWDRMNEEDWMQAFACHPRIGEHTASHASSQSSTWSRDEQSSINSTTDAVLVEFAEGNARYEKQYGFTYIVCATGKSPEEMLLILNRRLSSNRDLELREAAEQQRQIMHIRLRKWLEL